MKKFIMLKFHQRDSQNRLGNNCAVRFYLREILRQSTDRREVLQVEQSRTNRIQRELLQNFPNYIHLQPLLNDTAKARFFTVFTRFTLFTWNLCHSLQPKNGHWKLNARSCRSQTPLRYSSLPRRWAIVRVQCWHFTSLISLICFCFGVIDLLTDYFFSL